MMRHLCAPRTSQFQSSFIVRCDFTLTQSLLLLKCLSILLFLCPCWFCYISMFCVSLFMVAPVCPFSYTVASVIGTSQLVCVLSSGRRLSTHLKMHMNSLLNQCSK